jgi:hypothetical protein
MATPAFNTIPLGRGNYALVDVSDFEALSVYRWGYITTRGRKYATRYERGSKRTKVFMHREILGLTRGDKIQGDHINGDTLDNRRENLRPASHGQNQHNRKLQTNNTTGYKGVWFVKAIGRYRAEVKYKNKKFNAGTFDDPKQAALAYDKKAKELFGEFARTNFG